MKAVAVTAVLILAALPIKFVTVDRRPDWSELFPGLQRGPLGLYDMAGLLMIGLALAGLIRLLRPPPAE